MPEPGPPPAPFMPIGAPASDHASSYNPSYVLLYRALSYELTNITAISRIRGASDLATAGVVLTERQTMESA